MYVMQRYAFQSNLFYNQTFCPVDQEYKNLHVLKIKIKIFLYYYNYIQYTATIKSMFIIIIMFKVIRSASSAHLLFGPLFVHVFHGYALHEDILTSIWVVRTSGKKTAQDS